jgi:hypothetical protein
VALVNGCEEHGDAPANLNLETIYLQGGVKKYSWQLAPKG